MIRVNMTPERTKLITEAHGSYREDDDAPSSLVLLCLGQAPAELLIPTAMTRALTAWLGRANAYYGLGFPTTLKDMRTKLLTDLHNLDSHPALWGHGMLGYVNTPPLGVWRIPGARYPEPLYDTFGGGEEGFLVPTYQHGKGRVSLTSWFFEPMAHGSIRPTTTWFNSGFASVGSRNQMERDAASAKARVAKDIRSQAEESDEAWDLEDPAAVSED